MNVKVRLYTPADWSGRLICWRLESDYCHATLEIDGMVYSATMPHIVALPPSNPDVAQPPRGGHCFTIALTEEEKRKAKAYCTSMLGTDYDVLAMLGWALRIQCLQNRRRVYCFELVYSALAHAGVFPNDERLVTGEQLLNDLYEAGRVENMTFSAPDTAERAKNQRTPYVLR